MKMVRQILSDNVRGRIRFIHVIFMTVSERFQL